MKIIEYNEEYGEIVVPEGFMDELKGLSIEEQMKRYRWVWGENTVDQYPAYKEMEHGMSLDSDENPIVKDGIVVGVRYLNSELYPYVFNILPYQHIHFYMSDNNGAGYKESSANMYLVCW